MKKYILVLSVIIAGLASCKKDSFDPKKQAATDDATIQGYIAGHKIDSVQKGPSGLYYKILSPGTGAYPTVNSTVTVQYEGRLLNGTEFAGRTAATATVSTFIQGWQLGIPLINSGGSIMLIVPSGLAYGNTDPGGGIGKNAILIFTINLVSFTN